MAVDEARLEELVGRIVTELGAAEGVALHRIGDERGIWKAMAGAGGLTVAEVATRSGCNERYVREWLSAEAIAGYVEYDAATETFSISDEVAFTFADDESPLFMGGAWQVTCGLFDSVPKVTEAFRTGAGVAWADHNHDLFQGVERFFRPGYNANLIDGWLPALSGVVEKLQRGATVADVGCGHGASTIILAQAFPASTFVGFDYHDASIVAARKAAAEAGVADRVSFEVASAQSYPGTGYDLVCFFDCLHDMGDPDGAARHVRSTLADDGTWMLVEPAASDSLAESMNPVARVYYASSTLLCLPASLADEGHRGLGNQVPDAQLAELTGAAGFSSCRRATETPFNRVFEVKP
ncbi:MAG TPA: class I SAM-dependent methyltransferase [Acidimicrobiales bacterium]|nr:class I SAM-dependent methyltransferase [Acidimicrobiales bacterium]